MGYEVDYNPVDYLKRRVRYYKKRRGAVKNFNKSDFFIRQYGGLKNLNRLIVLMVTKIEARISEYEAAITKLQGKR